MNKKYHLDIFWYENEDFVCEIYITPMVDAMTEYHDVMQGVYNTILDLKFDENQVQIDKTWECIIFKNREDAHLAILALG